MEQHRHADADAEPVHRREQRLLERGRGIDELAEAVTDGGAAVGRGAERRHLREVLARRERAPVAGEDDALDVVTRERVFERAARRRVERAVERVQLLRAVERDEPDAVGVVDEEVGHAGRIIDG